jgi:hypothetical protein
MSLINVHVFHFQVSQLFHFAECPSWNAEQSSQFKSRSQNKLDLTSSNQLSIAPREKFESWTGDRNMLHYLLIGTMEVSRPVYSGVLACIAASLFETAKTQIIVDLYRGFESWPFYWLHSTPITLHTWVDSFG